MSQACDSCPSRGGCSSKGSCSEDKYIKTNANSDIKKVIVVASGKGGVGKSYVTSMLAVGLAKQGLKVGILDADITGPSIPKAFGLKDTLLADADKNIFPSETAGGIKVVSLNLLVDNEDTPVVWRAPVITGLVKQFFSEVNWGELDVLLIDMPPGTGDVPLTVYQSIPVDGTVIVTTPQDLVSMIVSKAVNMANMMNIPILGLVENMSYIKCPDCGKKIDLFGNGEKMEQKANSLGISILDRLPLDPAMSKIVDEGDLHSADSDIIINTINKIKGV